MPLEKRRGQQRWSRSGLGTPTRSAASTTNTARVTSLAAANRYVLVDTPSSSKNNRRTLACHILQPHKHGGCSAGSAHQAARKSRAQYYEGTKCNRAWLMLRIKPAAGLCQRHGSDRFGVSSVNCTAGTHSAAQTLCCLTLPIVGHLAGFRCHNPSFQGAHPISSSLLQRNTHADPSY